MSKHCGIMDLEMVYMVGVSRAVVGSCGILYQSCCHAHLLLFHVYLMHAWETLLRRIPPAHIQEHENNSAQLCLQKQEPRLVRAALDSMATAAFQLLYLAQNIASFTISISRWLLPVLDSSHFGLVLLG